LRDWSSVDMNSPAPAAGALPEREDRARLEGDLARFVTV